MKLWEIKKIRAEDQGDKDASDFREQILFDDICEAWTKNCMWQFWWISDYFVACESFYHVSGGQGFINASDSRD